MGSLYVYVACNFFQRAKYFQTVRIHSFDTLAETEVGKNLLETFECLVQDS